MKSPPKNINIRMMDIDDIDFVIESLCAEGIDKPRTLFEIYLSEQQLALRQVWLAFDADKFSGYITLKWQSQYAPFLEKGIPEISDFNVVPSYRRLGVGAQLMDALESIILEKSDTVGIGVGLYADYGSAQRMYAKRGYVPDGKGVTYNYDHAEPGKRVFVDDELLLWLTKKLR